MVQGKRCDLCVCVSVGQVFVKPEKWFHNECTEKFWKNREKFE